MHGSQANDPVNKEEKLHKPSFDSSTNQYSNSFARSLSSSHQVSRIEVICDHVACHNLMQKDLKITVVLPTFKKKLQRAEKPL